MRSMIPSGSWPGMRGKRTGSTPVYCSASLPQMPHASTRRSALSSSMSGRGNSRSSSERGPFCTTARVDRGATGPPYAPDLALGNGVRPPGEGEHRRKIWCGRGVPGPRPLSPPMVALLLPTQPMPHWRLAGAIPLAAVALTASVADALHQNSPGAVRVTHGVAVDQPVTHSWGFQVPFSSTEDLAHTGNSSRQIFVFGLFNYDCQNPTPGPALSCPAVPPPAVTQVTTGPGTPDN